MKFLKLLKKLKNLSDHKVHQMSCVIANKNQVVSIGFNKLKKHPRSKHPFKATHAELAAVLDNKFADLNGCTAFIYREHRDGSFALSRPCESCWETLRLAGIKKVCYTTEGSWKEELC